MCFNNFLNIYVKTLNDIYFQIEGVLDLSSYGGSFIYLFLRLITFFFYFLISIYFTYHDVVLCYYKNSSLECIVPSSPTPLPLEPSLESRVCSLVAKSLLFMNKKKSCRQISKKLRKKIMN